MMKYTVENIQEGIKVKLEQTFHGEIDSAAPEIYFQKLVNYPKEIEQNVLEWVNGVPFTYVDCHGESIKEIVDSFNVSAKTIPHLINNFIKFKNTGFTDPIICYRGIE